MTNFLLIISILYALLTLTLWVSWLLLPVAQLAKTLPDGPRITVVIPVRNEAETIGYLLNDLSQQTYHNFEVIVADDSSTDATLSIIRQYVQQVPYALFSLQLADEQAASPKKRAITQSIALATGGLILTTDGDCRVGPDWLMAFATCYEKTGAKLMSGPVTFTTEASIFDSLQTVEFASLIGTGACTIALGFPTMCNGANLCYVKEVFAEVGGFAGVDHLASGDDEFLMHKIAARYPAEIQFLKSVESIVQTQPHWSWRAFYNQRKRWASKWRAYESWLPSLLAVFVFLSNAVPIIGVAGWCLGFLNGNVTLLVIAVKAIPEFLFLRQVLVFLQKKSSVGVIPLTQLIYPLYVIFFGLAAQGKGYTWKGRNLK